MKIKTDKHAPFSSRRVRAVLIALIATFVASCFWDLDGNTQLVIACLGDSNTSIGYATWCHDLQMTYGSKAHKASTNTYVFDTNANVRVGSYARPGSTASCRDAKGAFTTGFCSADANDAQGQLLRALSGSALPGVDTGQAPDAVGTWEEDKVAAPKADVVVIASGSNDILYGRTAQDASGAIMVVKGLAESQIGNRVFVATVPPLWRVKPVAGITDGIQCVDFINDHGINLSQRVRDLNVLLRQQVSPERLIDLDTGFNCTHYTIDTGDTGLHMNEHGNALRKARGAAVFEREKAKWLASPH
ncbi:MAG: hypothetical protein JWN04_3047 [Myxococcaceae bacterium]|nr:hypothetical protein [Myxococcaceae bacterium]